MAVGGRDQSTPRATSGRQMIGSEQPGRSARPSATSATRSRPGTPTGDRRMNDVIQGDQRRSSTRSKATANNNLANVSIVIVGDGVGDPTRRHRRRERRTGTSKGFTGDTLLGEQINHLTGALATGVLPCRTRPTAPSARSRSRASSCTCRRCASAASAARSTGRGTTSSRRSSGSWQSGGTADPRTANTEPRTAFESDYDWFADGATQREGAGSRRRSSTACRRTEHRPTPQWTRQQFADAFARHGLFSPTDRAGHHLAQRPLRPLPDAYRPRSCDEQHQRRLFIDRPAHQRAPFPDVIAVLATERARRGRLDDSTASSATPRSSTADWTATVGQRQ